MSRGGFRGGGRGGGSFGRAPAHGPEIPDGMIVSFHEIPLYPDFVLPIPKVLGPQEAIIVEIDQQIAEDLKQTPYYIGPPPPKPDIERFSDIYKKVRSSRALTETPTRQDLSFFPEELHGVKDFSKSKLGQRLLEKNIDLEAITRRAQELDKLGLSRENDEDDEWNNPEEYDDSEEEGGDYGELVWDMDHYDAYGDDSDHGDDD
ncbi:DNA-directed RNA polymerase III, subunit Rpc31 [Polychytrium aggregatum]|uniref:DNA-directed RNA polymerase III, subunit Rpc31 n=1 Tax=Polychytrium aggregatum TaxID=110093 RepID=UPI0022FE7431|nr:DNA-directed RNA polymerase III, subunit Rpc31 [Polychytrium aggregatum]KAI9199626.1 DNA-directed RNA polymerase III, subunit Rpc31 [Polychytrium aggregatum]